MERIVIFIIIMALGKFFDKNKNMAKKNINKNTFNNVISNIKGADIKKIGRWQMDKSNQGLNPLNSFDLAVKEEEKIYNEEIVSEEIIYEEVINEEKSKKQVDQIHEPYEIKQKKHLSAKDRAKNRLISKNDLRHSIIMSEVLAKPLALRNKR